MGTVNTNPKRLERLKEWNTCKQPSCLIIGYELFRFVQSLLLCSTSFFSRLTCDMTKPNARTKKVRKLTDADKKLMKLQPQFRAFLQNPGGKLSRDFV